MSMNFCISTDYAHIKLQIYFQITFICLQFYSLTVLTFCGRKHESLKPLYYSKWLRPVERHYLCKKKKKPSLTGNDKSTPASQLPGGSTMYNATLNLSIQSYSIFCNLFMLSILPFSFFVINQALNKAIGLNAQ